MDLASLWWVPRVFWGPRRASASQHHNGIKWGGTLIIFSSSLCPWSPLLPAHLVPFTDPVPHSLGILLLDFPSFPAPFPLSLPPCCRCSKIRVMSDGHLGCPWLPSFDSAQGCSLCICLCKSFKHKVLLWLVPVTGSLRSKPEVQGNTWGKLDCTFWLRAI